MSLDSQVSTQAFYPWFTVLVCPLTLSSNSPDTKRPACPPIAHFHAKQGFEQGSWCDINCSVREEGILSASQPKLCLLSLPAICCYKYFFSQQEESAGEGPAVSQIARLFRQSELPAFFPGHLPRRIPLLEKEPAFTFVWVWSIYWTSAMPKALQWVSPLQYKMIPFDKYLNAFTMCRECGREQEASPRPLEPTF